MARETTTSMLVATLLGWCWAAVMLLLSVVAAIPALASGKGLPVAATSLLLSLASGLGAWGLQRGGRPWVILGAASAWILFLWLVPLAVSVAGYVVNGFIIGAVIANMRRLG